MARHYWRYLRDNIITRCEACGEVVYVRVWQPSTNSWVLEEKFRKEGESERKGSTRLERNHARTVMHRQNVLLRDLANEPG